MAFVALANISDITEGKVLTVDTKFIRVGLTKIQEKYYAFEDVCTHDGESMADGELDDCVLTCPRHFAQFDITNGEALSMPATEAIPTFAVRINDDKIEVDLED
ncbi:MAG: non-heme iron oxygenase ferredoxin subunit [Spirochaetota bacterium]